MHSILLLKRTKGKNPKDILSKIMQEPVLEFEMCLVCVVAFLLSLVLCGVGFFVYFPPIKRLGHVMMLLRCFQPASWAMQCPLSFYALFLLPGSLPPISVWAESCDSLELKRRKCYFFTFNVLVTFMSIAGIGEGLELAEREWLLWDCPGMLRWHMGPWPQPGALLWKNEATPRSLFSSPGNKETSSQKSLNHKVWSV